ncbi:MAG TPA: ABC transporter permease [Planctomycetota bacterium]|jgi:peptide/nickel transport system permease protein|nr:ABC transporter permease [Planctomycetota bacterium]
MRTYILRRLALMVPLLFGILTLNFFVIHAAPGDPADIFDNPDLPPEYRRMLRRNLGLDQPVPVQYVKYLKSVLVDFEFGYSFAKKRPVADEILDALPNTIQLSLLALFLELAIGLAVGIVAAVRQYSAFDNVSRVAALAFYSMPSFYLGLLFLFLFAGGVWHLLPASGMMSVPGYEDLPPLGKLWDRFLHIVLPAATLGIGSAAYVSRYMRGQLLEVIRQDYIRTARAKGLPERVVVFRHALRNALMPIVTLMGLSLPFLFSGAAIVENVFAWPGMGRVAVEAAFQRDYPMFLAVNLIFAAVVMLGNLLADLLYAVVDPRVRLE